MMFIEEKENGGEEAVKITTNTEADADKTIIMQ